MAKLAYPASAAKIDGNGTTTGLRSVTSRGFTDHEMLDNVGLIHMNGRVYDPNLGRFLSVDPVFAHPTNTQSLNPYTYVLNSPLTLVDPTGLEDAAAAPACTGEDECVGGGTPPAGSEEKEERKLNQTTSDPRSSHFARSNGKFNQTSLNNETGDIETRNLASGSSNWQATGLKVAPDQIGAVASRFGTSSQTAGGSDRGGSAATTPGGKSGGSPGTLNRRALTLQHARFMNKQVSTGKTTAGEALVSVVEFAAFLHDGAGAFVADLAKVLAGLDLAVRRPKMDDECVCGSSAFGDSGMLEKFRDGSNQVQHYIGGLNAGYNFGPVSAFHRTLRPDSPADTALNDVSTAHGRALGAGTLSIYDLGSAIRRDVMGQTP